LGRISPRFVFGRLLAALPVLAGVVVFTFVLMRLLPADPAAFFATGPAMGPDEVEALRRQLGLDRTVIEQLVIYTRDLATGNLGRSMMTGQPVTADLALRLPASLELTIAGFLLALAVALPLGILAATRPDSLVDHLTRLIATAGVSMPTFVTGLLLIFVFYYLLGWAPDPTSRSDMFLPQSPRVTGFLTIDTALDGNWAQFRAAWARLVLPAATMALFAIAPLARMTRASMLAALQGDFVRTARALGLSPAKVLLTYALRNAMIPVITMMGMVLSFMLGANVLVEKVFAWPGIGSYALDALVASDYAPVQGFVLVVAVIFVGLNLVVDLVYALVDPRVGFE
jgi:peptide/nickel transport system permease protein